MINIEKALSINGWMSPEELTWLAKNAFNQNIIVEFGSHEGRSTRALGDHVKEKVFAIDPWNGEYFGNNDEPWNILTKEAYNRFHVNLYDLIIEGRVVPYQCKSTDFIYPFPVDMVFIDGDHRYLEVKRDIMHSLKIVKAGGLICGHDYTHPDWPGVKKAVDEIFGKEKLTFIGSIWSLTV